VIPRIGQGFDIHPFSSDPARPLILAGVELPGPGLAGHSDADACAHAVADALLGAAGLGDICGRFPDTDPALAGAHSMELLAQVAREVNAGFEIGNVDLTVILETPRIAPYREEMERRLTAAVGAPVSVKAKRGEGLGAIGRREGVACLAVALIVPR
jgi:2-C-methyl-D-erythritol 2,4-cyclodiphosphate synthase